MTDTAVQDPQTQNILATEPSERKTSDRITMPWEYDERRMETEVSLQDDQAAVVAEAESIIKSFSSSGTLLNEFKPIEATTDTIGIQVEDKQVKASEFTQNLWLDMFKKPLEGLTNIAGGIVSEAPATVEAIQDLGKMIFTGPEAKAEDKQVKPEELINAQWTNFATQKNNETSAAINQVTMQRKMEEALYIVGAPPTENTAAELGLNTSMDENNLNTIDKYVWMAIKRSKDIKAAKQAKQAQEKAEVQQPVNLTNRLDAQEGQSMVANQIIGAG